MPARILESVAPARLGTGFRWLLASSWATNLGDGLAFVAGPLLVAARTEDPFLVSLTALVQWLPPFLLGLYAGALSDRHDRRRVVLVANAARVVVLAGLTAAIVSGNDAIGVVLGCLFLLGCAEVFVDNTSGTLLPMLVRRSDLGLANARLMFGHISLNQLVGPMVGAALFAIDPVLPFAVQAGLVLAGLLLFAPVRLPDFERSTTRHLLADVAEAFRWLLRHPAVRTLTLTILIFNVTYGAAWSVLVLYVTERLDLGSVGFGVVTAVIAAGGLVGTASYGRITRRVSLSRLMKIGLVLETGTHLALALTTSAPVALVVFFLFGAHAFIWGTTSTTVRQRAVPHHLQGRVGSAYVLAVFGGLAVGAGLGGVLAREWGVTAPFWYAFAGSALFVVLIWRQLAHIAHEDD